MTKKNSNKSYETKKHCIEALYKRYRIEWDGIKGHDDRFLFCNMYDQIMDALEEMKTVKNSLIWVGFDDEVEKDMDIMKDIIGRWNH